ncbi:MAG: hypothetical protein M3022_02370 [Actinomycetota bacterium]|nr:hypothetical protein [Actinomycetota bacterium]
MADAARSALVRTGHRNDTILVGETAAYGDGHQGYGSNPDPLVFIRALSCLGARYSPRHGAAATRIGCPGLRPDRVRSLSAARLSGPARPS